MSVTFTPMKEGENPRLGFDQTLSGTKLNARSAARRAKYRDVFFSNVWNILGRCKRREAIDYMDVSKPIPTFDLNNSMKSPFCITMTFTPMKEGENPRPGETKLCQEQS